MITFEEAFQQGGSPLFRPEALHRITPQHLWMIAKRFASLRLCWSS